jgi:hypothetical protein
MRVAVVISINLIACGLWLKGGLGENSSQKNEVTVTV